MIIKGKAVESDEEEHRSHSNLESSSNWNAEIEQKGLMYKLGLNDPIGDFLQNKDNEPLVVKDEAVRSILFPNMTGSFSID